MPAKACPEQPFEVTFIGVRQAPFSCRREAPPDATPTEIVSGTHTRR